MDMDRTDWEGGCHCGAVRLRARLPDGLNRALRCSCSICRMRGAVMVFAPIDGLAILTGEDELSCYEFNTGVAEHYFCSVCGIYTHHRRRMNPNEFAVNAACLEGVSPFDFAEVQVLDGRQHPLDDPEGRVRMLGVVKFEPNKS